MFLMKKFLFADFTDIQKQVFPVLKPHFFPPRQILGPEPIKFVLCLETALQIITQSCLIIHSILDKK